MLERLKHHSPMAKKQKMPRDVNQRAKATLDLITGDAKYQPAPEKDPRAAASGRLGGVKGGKARADALTPQRRSEIAKKAAQARWQIRPDSGHV